MVDTGQMLAEVFPPGEFLQEELEARGWSQIDFANILGKAPKDVNEIILGKRRITPEMARLVGQALDTSPNLWLNLESAYQLHRAEKTTPLPNDVPRRAKLFEKYPVREMVKRGWIELSEDVDALEAQLQEFHSPRFPYAARKRDDKSKEPLQVAWLCRIRHLAQRMVVEPYSELKLQRALDELKPLLQAPEEIRQVPEILRKAGVRFLLVEQLPTSKIDGMCCWLNDKSPVVGVSLRFDRIDHFWFTLMHEIYHVRYGHAKETAILDTDVTENDDVSQEERLADDSARDFLVPPNEMDDFIARVRPLFSGAKIRGFAKRIGRHEGIIVGQLHNRNLMEWNQQRKTLVKVRSILTQTATYDGWTMVA